LQTGYFLRVARWLPPPYDFGGDYLFGPYLIADHGWPAAVGLSPRASLYGFRVHDVHRIEATTLDLFTGPPVWHCGLTVFADTLYLDHGTSLSLVHPISDGLGAIRREPDPMYLVESPGHAPVSDTLRGTGGFGLRLLPLTAVSDGRMEFRTSYPYDLRRQHASLEVVAHVDPHVPLASPPVLESLVIGDAGWPTDSVDFRTARDPAVRFQVSDVGAAPPVVQVRPVASEDWVAIPVNLQDGEFAAALPRWLDGPVALRVSATDADGNDISWNWNPAFLAAGDPNHGPDGHPLALALEGVRPNPTRGSRLAARFVLPSPQPASLALYDVMGREVARRDLPAPAMGPTTVTLEGRSRLRAGIYFLRLEQGGASLRTRVCVLE
jgi:hypothetical protein